MGAKRAWRVSLVIGLSLIAIPLIIFSYRNLSKKPSKQQPAAGFTFRINNTTVTKEQFLPIYSYYMTIYENRDESLGEAKNLFVTNYVLKKEFLLKHNQAELASGAASLPPKLDYPLPPAHQLVNENAYMKKALFQEVGITFRNGEVLALRIHGKLAEGLTRGESENLAREKLTFYKKQFDTGTPFAQVKKRFLEDPETSGFNTGQAGWIDFERATPNDPKILAKGFAENVFALTPDTISNVIPLKNNQSETWALALIFVREGQDGGSLDINQWLAKEMQLLNVQTNFDSL